MNVEDFLSQYYKLDKIEEKIIKLAQLTGTPILSLSKAKILSFLISLKKPINVFEIGLGIGFSTYSILKSLSEKSTLISIDKNFHRIELFYEEIYKYLPNKLRRKLNVYPVDAFYCMDIFSQIGKKFDFIFIDSQKRDYYYLYKYFLKITKKGSVILIDNITYNMQTFKKITERSKGYIEGIKLVKKFLIKISKTNEFSTTFIPAGDGMAVLVRL